MHERSGGGARKRSPRARTRGGQRRTQREQQTRHQSGRRARLPELRRNAPVIGLRQHFAPSHLTNLLPLSRIHELILSRP